MTDPRDAPRTFEELPDTDDDHSHRPAVVWLARVLVFAGFVGSLAWSLWAGLSGTAFFGTRGSVATEYSLARESLRHAGVTPYSADQYLFLLVPAFTFVLLGLVVPVSLPARLRIAGVLAIVAALGCAIAVTGEAIAAANGLPFSNYLPRSYAGRSYVFPIAGFAIAALLFAAASGAAFWFASALAGGRTFRRRARGRRALL